MSLDINGKHPAKSLTAQLGKSGSGHEQIAIEFEFVDGPNKGQRITYYGSFHPNAEEYTIKALRAAGFQGDMLTDLSSLTPGPVCELVLGMHEYNGKSSVQVKFINALGGAAMKNPLNDLEKQSFAQRMKARFAQHDQANRTPARPATQPSQPAPTGGPAGDGLPF